MLSIPTASQTILKLKKEEYVLSCIYNIVIEWIDNAITGLSKKHPFVLSQPFDNLKITVGYFSTHIVKDEVNNYSIYNYEFVRINMLEFCTNLYDDISQNIDAWANCQSIEIENLEEKREELERHLSKLKDEIDAYGGDYINHLSACGCI